MQPRSSLSAAAQSLGISQHQLLTAGTTYAYVAFWIFTSAFVILYNKWILTVWGFAFPITLTMWHMAFCTVVSFALVRTQPHATPRVVLRSAATQQRGVVQEQAGRVRQGATRGCTKHGLSASKSFHLKEESPVV
jgi:hypothetical protein